MERMTKRDYFKELREVVAERADLVEFIDAQIALLDKKKGSVNSKKVAEVAEMTETVFNALAEIGRAATATEVGEALGISNQKATAYLKKLVEAERVVKVTEKKKSYFTVKAD